LWLVYNYELFSHKFIEINKKKFGGSKEKFGKKKIDEWLGRISGYKERGWKSAEDALTLSVLLKNRFAEG
jgi:hypothetical protein